VPKALRGLVSTAGRQGRRHSGRFATAHEPLERAAMPWTAQPGRYRFETCDEAKMELFDYVGAVVLW